MIASELIPPFCPLTVSPQLSRPSAAPGPALETFVGEDVNTMMIVNLLSGTEYSVKVIGSYSTGPSEALSGRAKTCKSILWFFDLVCHKVRSLLRTEKFQCDKILILM